MFVALGIDLDDALLEKAKQLAASASVEACFKKQDLLTFEDVESAFNVVFLYLLPDVFNHHSLLASRIWRAASMHNTIVVSMRWPLSSRVCDGELHAWESILVQSSSHGLAHQWFMYHCSSVK